MGIRTFFNSIKEGFIGIVRHPLVTIASVTTILLMLIIMSVFFVFSVNARFIMKNLSQQPPIEVYMNLGVSEADLNATANLIFNNPNVIHYEAKSPLDNYNYFKSNLGDSSTILDDFDYNMYLPYTFNIQISDPSLANQVASELSNYPGVNKVAKESNVMNFLVKAKEVVNVATVVSFVVLFVIALFIISNMVRISVYARSSEIEIMKFNGATNAYIRMPYVVEGAIVGLFSALLAWGISSLAYREIYYKAMHNIDPTSFYAILPLSKLTWGILILVALIGVLIGAIGSGISVRKYIKV